MGTLTLQPLLTESTRAAASSRPPSEGLRKELRQLALATDNLPDRSRNLFQFLRKLLGQPQLIECLLAIQWLVMRSEPAGARLLAALLDANTPGARLVPRIHSFTSCRRVFLQIVCGAPTAASLGDWQRRFRRLQKICARRLEEIPGPAVRVSEQPGREPPFPQFRRCLRYLVAAFYRHGDLCTEDKALMVGLARLEVDACQERISQLAGQVSPFRASAVTRVLPLLGEADTEVRDLREFIGRIEEGEIDRAFHHRQPRLNEVLEDRDRHRLLEEMSEETELSPLHELMLGLLRQAVPMTQMAGGAARLMALAHQVRSCGLRRTELDLLTAVRLVQRYHQGEEIRLPVGASLRPGVEEALAMPPPLDGFSSWPLDGIVLAGKELVLRFSTLNPADRFWRDDLPSLPAADARRPRSPDSASAASIKQLVLRNINSVSVLIGFLRNPKIVSVPGLVASVVQRCRSLIVLDLIANDRDLYSGYANRDVPMELLRSPCSIPLKTLRKFMQVKYVPKVELLRMVRDKVGLRDEVVKEINAYLKSLC
jgi:hypothetical protein